MLQIDNILMIGNHQNLSYRHVVMCLYRSGLIRIPNLSEFEHFINVPVNVLELN